VSLWDIVNQFNCAKLQILLERLRGAGTAFDGMDASAYEKVLRQRSKDGRIPDEMQTTLEELRSIEGATMTLAREAMEQYGIFCESAGFEEALLTLRFVGHHMSHPSPAQIQADMRRLEETLLLELSRRHFLRIDEDRTKFLDEEHLFGEEVSAAFPSAVRDIMEAGNCLAVECTTAAVFHLMRAAEFAMRALAIDRRISFPDKPLDQKEWGQILSKLESTVKDLRGVPLSAWTSPEMKDRQVRFYYEIVQELRSFNEAWRRHVAHADNEAFYDRDQALSIFNHVGAFMRKIATHISESRITPEFWDASQHPC